MLEQIAKLAHQIKLCDITDTRYALLDKEDAKIVMAALRLADSAAQDTVRALEQGLMSGGDMQLDEYQRLAQRTSRRDLSQEEHLLNAMLGLAGETGECCDLVKKSRYQDNRMIEEPLIDELGDVLWYVAEAASAIGVPLGGVAMRNIAKLRERYPDGFDPERSLHREEEQK